MLYHKNYNEDIIQKENNCKIILLMICDGFSKGILPAFCVEVIETSTGIKNDTDKTSVLSSSHLCLNVCSTHCLFLEINVIF